MEYPIQLGEEIIGCARTDRQGLYYQIDCRCTLTGEVLYKILVSCGNCQENLGICVPEGRDFVLRTKIPVKRLGDGELSFRAVPRHTEFAEKLVPLSPQEPFRYLSQLKGAYLERINGAAGIVIQEKPES